MAVIWIVAVAILGVLGAAISRQITDEFKAWTPWIILGIIDRAVRMLPEDKRERFAEEWHSHVNEIPGDVGKVIVAAGFLVASSRMARIPTAAGKRMVDTTLSAAAVALFLPLSIVTAIFIKLDSPGPIFFRQERIGRNGKRFQIMKFRTMSIVEDHAKVFRVTRVGRVLRRLRLDELPQLLNVLAGDMSLVGPHPRSPNDRSPSVLHQSSLKPGIVLDAEPVAPVTSKDQEERYKKELAYLRNHSLFLDLKIVARGVWRILTDRVDAL